MSRALVTGATGMLGSHVVERLAADGWRIRALVRRPAAAGWLESLGAELRPGDLLDAPSVADAARGCDAVVHTAALIGAGREPAPFFEDNVRGTRHVLRAATSAGARLVHVSSTAVLGEARYRHVPADESVPLPDLPATDHYGRSKQEAERLVLAGAHGGAWATVVRPPLMYGIRDRQFVPRVARLLRYGVFPLPGGGRNRLPLVHAGSVADGIARALAGDEAAGRIYHLTDDAPVTVAELMRHASTGLGWKVRTPAVPRAAGRVAFGVLARALSAVGRRDLAHHAMGTYRTLTLDNPFTSARARLELGWEPDLDPERALPAAFAWWRTGGDSCGHSEGGQVRCRHRSIPDHRRGA